MCEYIFVYGTLRPSLAPPELKELIGQWRGVGDGYVSGRLYDLGEYPGAVLDSDSKTRIIGEVFQLPDDGVTLAALDFYEGFDPQDSSESLFVRREAEVTLEDGGRLQCWVYVFNRRISPSILFGGIIESGDYLEQRWKQKQS